MQTDINEQVEKLRDGDPAAAREFIEVFYARIYAFLRRLTANESDAADLTQKTFGRSWKALPGFGGRSSLSSWIHSIAYHSYVDWRRGNHRTESRSEDWWMEQVCGAPGPDEMAARHDLAARLYASVEKLAPDLRDTVHLHYYQELTLQETADAMSVATSTVKYRLRQALAELESHLDTTPALRRPATTTSRL
jgi:RNA polymerase sigma-70 factor (ECF subfamily)